MISADFILYGKCETCRNNRFFSRKREITMPVGGIVKSQKRMCGKCYRGILKILSQNNDYLSGNSN